MERLACIHPVISRASPVPASRCSCAEESQKRRADLSLRSAPPGSRVVSFRKQNAATQGLQLGLKFRESFGKAVYIKEIIPGSQAAQLEAQGKLRVGDEITMVSATFGDEMWSARGIGKIRLEKSIAVRQGGFIKFVVEQSDDNSKKRMKEMAEKQKKQQDLNTRLQKQVRAPACARLRPLAPACARLRPLAHTRHTGTTHDQVAPTAAPAHSRLP